MGVSHHCTIPYVSKIVEDIIKNTEKPTTMLDIGFGSGYYPTMFRQMYPRDRLYIVGVEAFPEYIYSNLRPAMALDEIYINNIMEIYGMFWEQHFDVVLILDVIEHLKKEEGEKLIGFLKKVSGCIVITTPLCDYPQGALNGNDFEIHRCKWTIEEFEKLGFTTVKTITFGDIQHPDKNYTNANFMGVFKWVRE